MALAAPISMKLALVGRLLVKNAYAALSETATNVVATCAWSYTRMRTDGRVLHTRRSP